MRQRIFALTLLSILLTGCGSTLPPAQPNGTTAPAEQTAATAETEAETTAADQSSAAYESSLAVASGNDVIAANAVGYEGMEPVTADQVKPGE